MSSAVYSRGASSFTDRKGLVTPLDPHCPDGWNVDMTNQITVWSSAYFILHAQLILNLNQKARL